MANKICRTCGKPFQTKTSSPNCDICRGLADEPETTQAQKKLSYLLKAFEKGQELIKERVSPCRSYDLNNLTCIRCRENGEEKYRGCFKK